MVGYHFGKPTTVVDRINMWLSPWDNDVHGGNQLAHSLWAFSTGGALGSGPGWGDPAMIPAGHTDLVLPAVGEEWGFCGVATVLLLLGFLVWRGMRIGLRAPSEYGMFLALGLSALIAFEMLLISGGVLGAIPLSGVVSPFLSFGNTAMLANFLIFGIFVAISNQGKESVVIDEPFRKPMVRLEWVLGAAAATLLGFAAYYQLAHDQDFLAREAKVFEDDGVKRPQRNPRLEFAGARDSARKHFRPKWRIARDQRLGVSWSGIAINTRSWVFRSTRPARGSTTGIIRFGSLTAHLLGDCEPAIISTRRMRR